MYTVTKSKGRPYKTDNMHHALSVYKHKTSISLWVDGEVLKHKGNHHFPNGNDKKWGYMIQGRNGIKT